MRMKAFYAVAALAMGLGMTACSSSDDLNGENTNPQTGESTNYVAVSIRDMNTAGAMAKDRFTRADDETHGDGTYADGDAREGTVGTVRFYFFDENDDPYPLANSAIAGANFLDHDFNNEAQTSPVDGDNTIERRTAATLVLNGTDITKIPSKIVALVNYGALTPALDNGTKTLEQLESLPLTTSFNSGSGDDTRFFMSNSVYKSGNNIVIAHEIPSEKLHKDRTAANGDPVDVYVERLAAKVTVDGNNVQDGDPRPGSTTAVATWGRVNGQPAMIVDSIDYYSYNDAGTIRTEHDDVPLRAIVQGWNLADENSNGKILKDITNNDEWVSRLDSRGTVPSPLWNTDNYFRCFWEESATYARKNGTWNNATTAFGGNLYTMPNTTDYKEGYENGSYAPADSLNYRPHVHGSNGTNLSTIPDLTKIFVAAKLQYYNGSTWQNADLWRFQGRNYLSENDVKKAIAAVNSDIQKSTDGGVTKSPITYNDITIANATEADNYKGYSSDYQLKISLAGTAGVTYWRGNIELNTATVNEGSYVTHYNDGDTYYYTTIQHLWNQGNPEQSLGYFGVVRNHWYRITINSLNGPGTPVPNPDIPVVPVTPQETLSYMSARINVQQWRVVTQNVNINGNTKTSTTGSTTTSGAKRR